MNISGSAGFRNWYPGWSVLIGVFISAAVAIGFTSYIFGMFAVPVSEEFGLSRAEYNNGFIALMAGVAFAAATIGKLLDRYSARHIMAVAGILFGFSFIAISQSTSVTLMLLLLAVPIPAGVAACGVVGANTVIVRWFERRRGRVMGVLALSTSVGGFLAQPATGWLIVNLGWREALLTLGLTALVLFTVLPLFLIRNHPRITDQGYASEFPEVGSPSEDEQPDDSNGRQWSQLEVLKTRNFWFLALGVGIFFGVDQAILISQVPFFLDAGYSMEVAAMLVSIKTVSAIGGKLLVGFLTDKIDLRLLFAAVAFCNISLLCIYMIQPNFWVLVVALTFLGIAVGGVFPVWTMLVAWLFGTRSYGTVIGMTSIGTQIFAIVGARFIGEMYDSFGSYTPAFALFIGAMVLAIVLIRMTKPFDSAV